MPVGAEWNACWNRRRACSRARTRSSRSVTSSSRTIAVSRSPAGWSTATSTRVVRAVDVAQGERDRGVAGRVAPGRAIQPAIVVAPFRADEVGQRRADELGAGRPVSSTALALASRTLPTSSIGSTASGSSSSRMRSSFSAPTRRSIVWCRWAVIRRDSSQLTATAIAASAAMATMATTTAVERSSPATSTRMPSPTSSTPAATTDRTQRHVAARRRVATPSVTSSPHGPDATRRCRPARGARHLRVSIRVAVPGTTVEARPRRIGTDLALVEADLEQEGERLTDERSGVDAEVIHHRPPVELGADRGQLLGGRELVDARLEVVHPLAEADRLALVAGGAVAAGEHVELAEQGAGVAHVAAHRGVAPPHLVGVEAEVQGDELGDGLDVGVGVPQRLHALARHPRPDHVVVVERGPLALLEAARARLADVVEQRGEAGDAQVVRAGGVRCRRAHVLDDGDRVAEDVLVAVDRIVLEAQRRQLRQEVLGEPGVDEEPQPGGGVVDHHQLVELGPHPLGGHDLEAGAAVAHRVDELRRRGQVVAGDEPGGAQHPQRVVVEAHLRCERRLQRARGEVGGAAEGVDERSPLRHPPPASSRAIALTVKSRRARGRSRRRRRT